MSTTPPVSSTSGTVPPAAARPNQPEELKLISHSNLFYWWPVWALAFFMALWTYAENHRLAIVPAHGTVKKVVVLGPEGAGSAVKRMEELEATDQQAWKGDYLVNFHDKSGANPRTTKSLEAAVDAGGQDPFRPRMSQDSWLGAVFLIGLLLTIFITNVPLRGLWSFIVLVMIVVVALFISLLRGWDEIFDAFGNLRIHINMAGYLFIGVSVFAIWLLATFVFDRRSYIIFTPGSIMVCEHIGASVQMYSTMGVNLEKQRDDMFRHYILGFGSGDLIVRTGGAERHEIKMPNVLGIGWRLKKVEELTRKMATVNN